MNTRYSAAAQIDAFELDEESVPALAETSLALTETRDDSARVQAHSVWITMENGEQLHLKHFKPTASSQDAESLDESGLNGLPGPGTGRSVFMLHGEAECGRVYYDSEGQGLAWYLANNGYEVFVADLGGRGRSLVPDNTMSALTVDDIIVEAVPRFLQAATKNSIYQSAEEKFTGPDIWIGHGFGCATLAAAWARMSPSLRSATQMIFFSGRRRFTATQRLCKLFVNLFCHPLTGKLVDWKTFFPAVRLGLGSADENASWYRTYINWMHSKRWLGADGFDYIDALKHNPLPSTMYMSAQADTVFSNTQDIRNFIAELGQHDARLVVVDNIAGSKRRYNHLAMLLDPAAEKDIFAPIGGWLVEHVAMRVSDEYSVAESANELASELAGFNADNDTEEMGECKNLIQFAY